MEILKKDIKVLYTMEEIQKRIKELGAQITKDYDGKELVVICILKGAIFYTVDLVKNIDLDLNLEFMKVSSYEGTESTGVITIKQDITSDIKGKDVLVVEDIIDTGRTLRVLREELLKRGPSSLKITTFLDKKERREVEMEADYVGYEIPNKFVVGYGLDVDENFRNLQYICYIEV